MKLTAFGPSVAIVVNATTPHTWGLNTQLAGIGSPESLGKGGYVVFALPEKARKR